MKKIQPRAEINPRDLREGIIVEYQNDLAPEINVERYNPRLHRNRSPVYPIPITEFNIKALMIFTGQEGDYLSNQLHYDEEEKAWYYVLESFENSYGDWNYCGVKVEYIHEIQNIHYCYNKSELMFDLSLIDIKNLMP